MNDRLSASWVLVVGSVFIAYWFWKTKPGSMISNVASGSTNGMTPGIAPTKKSLGDLLSFASFNRLRAVENSPGHYILVPQPGWKFDFSGLADTARKQGFKASGTLDQLFVDLPYEQEEVQGNIPAGTPPIAPPPYQR